MKIFRVVKDKNYTTINNTIFKDKTISCKTKGFFATIMSLPDNWDFSVNGIKEILLEGKSSVYSFIDELEANGYLTKKQVRNSDGKLSSVEYVFYETPVNKEFSPCSDLPLTAEPLMVNRPQLSTNIINNLNNNSLVGSFQTPTKKDSKKDLFKTKLTEVDVTTLDNQEQVYFKIAIGFRDLFIKNKKALGFNDFRDQENATYKNYVDPIRLSFTQDKKTEEDFRKVYAFLMNDEFWMKNIMSTSKLREKMSDLLIRSSSVPTKKQILPSDFWVRELSDEQKKLLSDKDLATWERQKTARLMEGGRMLPIKIEYEK